MKMKVVVHEAIEGCLTIKVEPVPCGEGDRVIEVAV
jgi:hypothetical protein